MEDLTQLIPLPCDLVVAELALSKYCPTQLVGLRRKYKCVFDDHYPDPDKVLVCVAGHHVCEECANRKWKKEDLRRFGIKECCYTQDVSPDASTSLRNFLEEATIRCLYFEKGCNQAQLAGLTKYKEHVRACEFKDCVGYGFKCRYFGCWSVQPNVAKLIAHYVNEHQANVLDLGTDRFAKFKLGYEESAKQRLCALLKFKGRHYVFAVQINEGRVFIWVWDLEHEAIGCTGKLTSVWYRLRLRKMRKLPEDADPELGQFHGRALSRHVNVNEIIEVRYRYVYTIKMELETFKEFFVSRSDDGKLGGWKVTVMLEDNEKDKESEEE